jgi:DnaJ family protein B protein 12
MPSWSRTLVLMFVLGPGMFDTGPQFMFNLGGGPGIRVHQFGGARPRRRPREAGAPEQTNILGLLPLLIIILLPLLNSLFFGGDSTPSGPQVRFNNPDPPYTLHRTTKNLKVDYYVNPKDVEDLSRSKLSQLDNRAEVTYVQQLKVECEKELDHRQRLVNDAQGWFYQDADKINYARGLPLHSCKKLESMGQIQKGSLPI